MQRRITGKTPEELRNNYHGFLRQYQAVFDKQTSDSSRHIFFSRPTGKWIKAVHKGATGIDVSFHDDCPCSED
jgi:hypothetical protein